MDTIEYVIAIILSHHFWTYVYELMVPGLLHICKLVQLFGKYIASTMYIIASRHFVFNLVVYILISSQRIISFIGFVSLALFV